MSVTGSGVSSGGAEWVSVTEAAGLSRVSERTIQRWVEAGKVVSEVSGDGRRLVRRASLPGEDGRSPGGPGPADSLWARVSDRMADRAGDLSVGLSDNSHSGATAAAPAADMLSDMSAGVVESPTRSDPRHGLIKQPHR